MEVPVQGSSYLHVGILDGRNQALFGDGSIPMHFDLAVPTTRRSAEIWWPSTKGHNDMSVELTLEKLTGELWMFLRSDDKTGEGLGLGISKGFVTVMKRAPGEQRQLAVFHPAWPLQGPFVCRAVLVDNTLRLYVNGTMLGNLTDIPDAPSRDAQFGMMIYDRVRGSAQVTDATILFTPLSKDLIKTIESLSVETVGPTEDLEALSADSPR